MDIYLMQHGEALPEDVDPERGLSKEGERQARASGKALKMLEVDVNLIVTSTKKRAKQTALIVASELGYPENEIVVSELFDPLSPAERAVDFLKGYQKKEKILVAGHLPSLGEIASFLLCKDSRCAVYF
ncbi:MAG: phosphohistidine phosphatase SixA, partial [Candidatus Bathyarchaeia archaeon]